MPGAAKWEIEVDGVWKVPPSLELIAWLEDQYLNNKQSKVNLRGSLQVSCEVQCTSECVNMWLVHACNIKILFTSNFHKISCLALVIKE